MIIIKVIYFTPSLFFSKYLFDQLLEYK